MAGYGTDSGLSAYLAANGLSLPIDAPALAVLREQGSVYIDGLHGSEFSGYPTGGFLQERAWPRTGAYAFGSEIPSDVIPTAIQSASYAAAFQAGVAPGSLNAVASGIGNIKREKTDVLETEYFAGYGDALADATPRFAVVEGLLAPFLAPTTGAAAFVV